MATLAKIAVNIGKTIVELKGVSIAARGTTIVVPAYNLAFDYGVPLTEALGISNIFVSHAHTDHCGALAYHVRSRRAEFLPAANYYVPAAAEVPLRHMYSAVLALDTGIPFYTYEKCLFFNALPTTLVCSPPDPQWNVCTCVRNTHGHLEPAYIAAGRCHSVIQGI
jgi:glyoxylase-like metal-dependent hydrolase (beta-lactamase superfamily II)